MGDEESDDCAYRTPRFFASLRSAQNDNERDVPLNVDIVTAERVVFSEEGVDELVLPGVEGELAVLPRHAALMTMIQPGVMRIIKGGEETEMAITGGFIEVRENRVTVLADAAERAEEIDTARAEEARRGGGGPGGRGKECDPAGGEEARRRAERLLEERTAAVDLSRAEAALARALVRLKVAERRRRRTGARPGPFDSAQGRPPGA